MKYRNSIFPKKLSILILICLIILMILESIIIPSEEDVEQDEGQSPFDFFLWVIIIVAIFFSYLFITRWYRRKNYNQPYQYQQTEPKIFNEFEKDLKNEGETGVDIKKHNLKTYTCSNCQFTGTKKDRAWYKSQKSGEIICGICYQKNKEKKI